MEKTLTELEIAKIAQNNLLKATGAIQLTRQQHEQLQMDIDFLYNKSLESDTLKKLLDDANATISSLQDKAK